MKKSPKEKFIMFLFFLHLGIVIIWLGLFFIPLKIRPGRVVFHFWYILIILLIQFLWACILTKKPGMICPFTTWMQYLRGYKLKDKRNYMHSFIAELLEIFRIKANFQTINIFLLLTFVLAALKYFFHI